MDKKRIAWDLDNTLCTGYPYIDAMPNKEMIHIVNDLSITNYIIIYTARGMKTFNDRQKATNKYWHLTYSQLIKWGIKFDELIMGKPDFDIIIDDKAFNSRHIFKKEDVYHALKHIGEK